MNEIEPELDMDCDVDFNMDRDIDVDMDFDIDNDMRANSVDKLCKCSTIVIGSIENSKNVVEKRQIFVDKALLVC